jgi:hypothetical protein
VGVDRPSARLRIWAFAARGALVLVLAIAVLMVGAIGHR